MLVEVYLNGAGMGALKNPVGKKLPSREGNMDIIQCYFLLLNSLLAGQKRNETKT